MTNKTLVSITVCVILSVKIKTSTHAAVSTDLIYFVLMCFYEHVVENQFTGLPLRLRVVSVSVFMCGCFERQTRQQLIRL